MNHFFKKVFCVFLSLILILGTALSAVASENTIQTAVAAEPKLYADTNIAAYQDIDADTVAFFMELIKNAVLNCEDTIDISSYNIPFTQETLNAFYALIAYGIPEAFHVSALSCTYRNNIFRTLKPQYTCTAEEYEEMLEDCTDAADKLLNGIKNNSTLTAVEKALLLHDRLALHCEYGNIYADRSETATLYSALVLRKPVCQGYAIAYIYLLAQVGIESELVLSETLNHAWNIVYINNKPYHVDVTWDDPTPDAYGRVMHNNFLLSTNALKQGINDSKGHVANDYTSTPVDTTYDSYYWQNSESAFQLLNGKIYYIDNLGSAELRKLPDHSKVCDLSDIWKISNDGYYMPGNYSKLACVNNKLYCSLSTGIYEVNTQTGALTEFKKPTLSINGETFYSIYGFAYENNVLYFDFANRVSGYINYAKTSVTVSAPACTHGTTQIRNKVDATCGTDGYTGDCYCTACNMKTAGGSVIPATGNHTWNGGSLTTIPTCRTTGSITYTCTVCAQTKTETTAKDATNHIGGTTIVGVVDVLCFTDGYTGDRVCLGCNAVLTAGSVIPATGYHTWNSGSLTAIPTCCTTGTITYTCAVCSETKTQAVTTDATNHSGGTEIIGKIDAGCFTDGYTGDKICRGCDTVLQTGSVIPASGAHKWDNGIITTLPTPDAVGEKTYTCTVCGDTRTEPVDAVDAFIDKEGVAILDENGNIRALAGTTVAQYLTQVCEGSYITDANDNLLADGAVPGTGSLLVTPNGTQYRILVMGDINGDGRILSDDARTALRVSVRLDTINEAQSKAGNVSGDGNISSSDARSILRASVGLDDPADWIA